MTDRRRLVELAVRMLETERARIDEELAALRQELGGGSQRRRATTRAEAPQRSLATTTMSAGPARRAAPNKGKPMSVTQKRKIAAAMRKRWKERRTAGR